MVLILDVPVAPPYKATASIITGDEPAVAPSSAVCPAEVTLNLIINPSYTEYF
jgi:hypothetical protein